MDTHSKHNAKMLHFLKMFFYFSNSFRLLPTTIDFTLTKANKQRKMLQKEMQPDRCD